MSTVLDEIAVATAQVVRLEDKTDALAMSRDTFSRNTRIQLGQVFDALGELMTPSDLPRRPINFVGADDKGSKRKPWGQDSRDDGSGRFIAAGTDESRNERPQEIRSSLRSRVLCPISFMLEITTRSSGRSCL